MKFWTRAPILLVQLSSFSCSFLRKIWPIDRLFNLYYRGYNCSTAFGQRYYFKKLLHTFFQYLRFVGVNQCNFWVSIDCGQRRLQSVYDVFLIVDDAWKVERGRPCVIGSAIVVQPIGGAGAWRSPCSLWSERARGFETSNSLKVKRIKGPDLTNNFYFSEVKII